MLAMPDEFYCLAVDLRGYGDTEEKIIDATRGARDWSDDLAELVQALGLGAVHWVGWSAGAAAIMQLCMDHGALVRSLTLIAPISPFGFGGTRGEVGEPCFDDYAGSGAGVVGKEFIEQIRLKDKTQDLPVSPLSVIYENYIFKPQKFAREKELLEGSLKQSVGEQQYPGDFEVSANWPYVSPGVYGPINAVSARHYNMSAFADLPVKPPVIWIHGDQDVIVSNHSNSDMAVLGAEGLVAGWPGAVCFPPQAMIDQMRFLMQAYCRKGGIFEESVMADIGHSPFIEAQSEFLSIFLAFLSSILSED